MQPADLSPVLHGDHSPQSPGVNFRSAPGGQCSAGIDIGSCRRELLDRTLIWNQRHLLHVLRSTRRTTNVHRPHRSLEQAAPLKPLPDGVVDLESMRVHRAERIGGAIAEYIAAA